MAYVNDNRDDWDDHLPYLCMAYRAAPHSSTGCSPNLMFFGTENNMPIDIIAGRPPSNYIDDTCPVAYVEWLRQTFSKVYEFANDHLQTSAKRQKKSYDSNCKNVEYKTGDFVWRFYPPAARGKLAKGWQGPYRVLNCPNTVNVNLQMSPENTTPHRVHKNSLKPFYGDVPVDWADADARVLSGDDGHSGVGVANPSENEPALPESEPQCPAEVACKEESATTAMGRGCRNK